MLNKVSSEDRPEYASSYGVTEQETIDAAIVFLERRMVRSPDIMLNTQTVKNFLSLKFAETPHEVFCCIWLDTQNRLLEFSELFRGTLSQTSVYPREVLKEALRLNAGAVIFAHNHPSGTPEPSRADERLTAELKTALAMVEVRVLDHVIVGGANTTSFAERGLL